METATALPAADRKVAPAGEQADSARVAALELRQLQRLLLRAVSESSSADALLAAVGRIAAESLCPAAARYFHRDEERRLGSIWQFFVANFRQQLREQTGAELLAVSERACKKGFLQIDHSAVTPSTLIVAAPVFLRNRPPDALAVAIPASTSSLERMIAVVQLLASHITMWHILQEFNLADAEAQTTAALLEILSEAQKRGDLQEASHSIAAGLQGALACQRVAIGIKQASTGRCRIVALSDHAKFDKNASFVRTMEGVLDEALLRGTLAEWPPKSDVDRHATRAQHKFGKESGAAVVVTAPLAFDAEDPIGAWLFSSDQTAETHKNWTRVIRASALPVASCLRLLLSNERHAVSRWLQRLHANRKSWQLKALVAACGILAGVLCIPASYQVKCDCELQPVTRRFVEAPFEGRLETALVEPGDIVRQGEPLARMDGRDIRWELAGIEAERGHAAKRRDAGLAVRDMVASQLASLDLEKLEQKDKILQHRFANLEIKSPIDGVVISGDQQRAEGAPLTIGQALFEVAPLEQMVVQLEVPEEDIAHVRVGMQVNVRLDALPRLVLRGKIDRVHPRSEILEDANVFIAEVHVANEDGQLRPGMDGRAKISSDRRALGWNYFHKPWNFMISLLGW